jgi:hypothetical protein
MRCHFMWNSWSLVHDKTSFSMVSSDICTTYDNLGAGSTLCLKPSDVHACMATLSNFPDKKPHCILYKMSCQQGYAQINVRIYFQNRRQIKKHLEHNLK